MTIAQCHPYGCTSDERDAHEVYIRLQGNEEDTIVGPTLDSVRMSQGLAEQEQDQQHEITERVEEMQHRDNEVMEESNQQERREGDSTLRSEEREAENKEVTRRRTVKGTSKKRVSWGMVNAKRLKNDASRGDSQDKQEQEGRQCGYKTSEYNRSKGKSDNDNSEEMMDDYNSWDEVGSDEFDSDSGMSVSDDGRSSEDDVSDDSFIANSSSSMSYDDASGDECDISEDGDYSPSTDEEDEPSYSSGDSSTD